MAADQRQGQLVGQELVIGQARAFDRRESEGGFRIRVVQFAQRVRKAGEGTVAEIKTTTDPIVRQFIQGRPTVDPDGSVSVPDAAP